jgi:hypothetical protein
MTHIPGARAELDRAGEWLYGQVGRIVMALTGDRDVPRPVGPAITGWDDPLLFDYSVHVEHPLSLESGVDPVERARSLLASDGFAVTVSEETPRAPANVTAGKGGYSLMLLISRAKGTANVFGRTPPMALYEPRSLHPVAPDCPRCEREMTALQVLVTRNRWGGAKSKPRHELWWECSRCGSVGYQAHEGEPLNPMRRLEGSDGSCFFCGEDDANVVSEPETWQVCLACGTSNPLRIRDTTKKSDQPD